jgi:hypothetical protein
MDLESHFPGIEALGGARPQLSPIQSVLQTAEIPS